MIRDDRFALGLVAVGILLLVVPAAAPLDPMLTHETYPTTPYNESQLEQRGYEVVDYENLSDRGQELYVETLRNGGRYTVPAGQGAPEFAYPTDQELSEAGDYREVQRLRTVVIERPENADLPPADEQYERYARADERADEREGGSADRPQPSREQVMRWDMMTTGTEPPSLTSVPSLLRLLSVLVGVVAIGTGGYLRAQP